MKGVRSVSSRQETYERFIRAVLQGNEVAAQELVAPGFRASILGTYEEPTLTEFVREVARQRQAFPDLGENVEILVAQEREDLLVITYMMIVHFTGTLTSADGMRSISPNGNEIAIPSQDRVVFTHDGRIQNVEIVTDMGDTLAQMF